MPHSSEAAMTHVRPTLLSPVQGWALVGGILLGILGLAFRPPPPAVTPAVGPAATPPQNTQAQTRAVPVAPSGGNAASNNRMIAVTGMDVTGQSVLFLVDTERYRLAVYQAAGGSSSTQGVRLVAARNISLDLELDGFNDKTEHDGRRLGYKDLEKQFTESGLLEK